MLGAKKNLSIEEIIERLKEGEKFGLFDASKANGGTYYFEDGSRMRNEDLWEALRVMNNLEYGHGKTLRELCPNNFIGTFNIGRKRHNWSKA